MLQTLVMICFWFFLFGDLYRKRKLKEYGVCLPKIQNAAFHNMPLLLLAIVNVAICNRTFVFWTALWLVISAMGEEFFFRGFLLSWLMKKCKNNSLLAVIISSFLFAVMHVVNIREAESFVYIVMQILCAGMAGFCFTIVAWREKSIFWSTINHSLINITSIGNIRDEFESMSLQTYIFGIVTVIYFIYGIILYKKTIRGR